MRYRFDECVLDTDLYTLERQGHAVRLPRRVFQVLEYLLAQRHRVVSRDELFAQIWGEQFVSDAALESCIKQVRQAVGDSGRAQRLIRTQHGYGYRFMAAVMEDTVPPAESAEIAAPCPDSELPQAPPEGGSDAAPAADHPDTLAVPSASEPSAEPSRPAPERRQLTVLSCALAEAAALAAQLEPDDLHDVVQAWHAWCTAIVQQLGGAVAQRAADRVEVYFGAPQAHDDDARRAVEAGLRLLEAARTRVVPGMAPGAGGLAVCIGMHTGAVVLSPLSAEEAPPLAVGATSMIAAGLRERAAPQTVVISAATAALVRGYFTWQPLAPWTPPGHREALASYRVTGATGARMRLDLASPAHLTPFVGREPELALFQERWVQAQEGRGQVVVLSGEAGIGKSRLVRQVAQRLAGEACTVLESRGVPYAQHTAFAPVRELVQQVVGWDTDAVAGDRVARLEACFQQYALETQAHLPFLAALLNLALPADRYSPLHLTPQQHRRRTLETLATLPVALAVRRPLLLILEDLHWIDPSTLEWLGLLLDQVPTSRILVVLTCRPAFQVPWPRRSYLTQVTLGRLTPLHSTQMVAHVARARGALPGAVVEQIVGRTDGVPLFIEELTRALLNAGTEPGAPAFPGQQGVSHAAAIPATLQETLMARLDQVGEAKRTAQVGAVIGRQFRAALLRAVSPLDEAAVQQDLRRLVASELLYQRGVGTEATYLFKHALIQDAAYQSLLKRSRQVYHQQIAQQLEAQFPETKATQPELLAHHYTEAGLTESAIIWWQRAGELARRQFAFAEAVRHLTQGVNLLHTLAETPERLQRELEMQLLLGESLDIVYEKSVTQGLRAYTRARTLCEQLGATQQRFRVLLGFARYHQEQGENQRLQEINAQLLALAQDQHDIMRMVQAHNLLGQTLRRLGDLGTAQSHLEQAIELYTHHRRLPSLGDVDVGESSYLIMSSLFHYAVVRYALGYPDAIPVCIAQMRQWAQDIPFDRSWLLWFSASLYDLLGELDTVRERLDLLLPLVTEHGIAVLRHFGMSLLGYVLVREGQGEAGMALIQRLLASLSVGGLTRLLALTNLARAYSHVNQPEDGLRVVAEAFELVGKTGEQQRESTLHRLKGQLLLQQAPPATSQAETCFKQALDIARHQHAKSWELHAATSLARLWQQQGKCRAAYDLLAPVYHWFTEGFDAADLREARTLMQALSS